MSTLKEDHVAGAARGLMNPLADGLALERVRAAAAQLNDWATSIFSKAESFGTTADIAAGGAMSCAEDATLREINGVKKALSAEYTERFGVIVSDISAVEAALERADRPKR